MSFDGTNLRQWAKTILLVGLIVLFGCGPSKAESDTAIVSFETPDFRVALQKSSQTLVSLAPRNAKDGFDFAPSGRFAKRLGDGNYRLGDIDVRLRQAGARNWQDYSSAYHRVQAAASATSGNVLSAADISRSMGPGFPLTVKRTWSVDGGKLILSFMVTNPGKASVEIGGLGLPMIFDNIITDRDLDEAHRHASFADPYVGRDSGYLQVTRLNGSGPALLVLPEKTTSFELYKPILDERDAQGKVRIYNDVLKRGTTFEGFYSWMVASKGFADTEWRGARQWNETTSIMLKPGETRRIGVRFVLSPSIRAIEPTLMTNARPVAVGLPGYVVPTDMEAQLFVHSPALVKTVAVYPVGGLSVGPAVAMKDGWVKYTITGRRLGRARLTLTYANGETQTVHYLVTKPQSAVVADFGRFLTTRQWYVNPKDGFGRSPSVMTYDHETGRIVTEDNRAWVAGLSDEGGAGAWLSTIMKQLDNPDPAELAKFESFARTVLWGRLQVAKGPDIYAVHKSLFYYDLARRGTYDSKLDWSKTWDKKGADDLGRSFNYPHAAAAWWTLYRLARFHQGLVSEDWQTSLIRAAETIKAMMAKAPEYTPFGQMEGDVFVAILDDLKREGLQKLASDVEALMKRRADHWKSLKYPFGSEMAWDSTGQEEVYAWMRYFGHDRQAESTREVILGYDPALPHWGYNGSARRYWDFLYAGKLRRVERQLHHYGSSINAIPLLDSFRRNPDDFHLIRVGYAGVMGSLTNIGPDGFASAAFHSFPDAMKWDGINGDYGSSFFGHAWAAASYLTHHPVFGWIGFGGNVTAAGDVVDMVPKDSARTRVFIAPARLWLTFRAGRIERVRYDRRTGDVTLTLARKDTHTPQAWFEVESPGGKTPYRVLSAVRNERGLYVTALNSQTSELRLAPFAVH